MVVKCCGVWEGGSRCVRCQTYGLSVVGRILPLMFLALRHLFFNKTLYCIKSGWNRHFEEQSPVRQTKTVVCSSKNKSVMYSFEMTTKPKQAYKPL